MLMENNSYARGILLVAVSAASFGVLPIFTKFAYQYGTGTYTLLFLRFLVGAVFMLSLISIRKMPLPSAREIGIFLLMGGVVYVGQSTTFFLALRHASAGVVSLLLYLYPAFVTAGSVLFFGERIMKRKLLALVMALLGAAVIVAGELQASPLGVVLAIASSVIYTFYILASSKLVRPGMGPQSSGFIFLGAAAVYGVLTLIFGFQPPTEPAGYIPVILLGLISTVVAMGTLLAGMEITGPSAASLVSTLEPLVTVLLSVLVLHEKLTWNVVLGGVLVMTALFITAKQGNA